MTAANKSKIIIAHPSKWARCLLKDRENHLPGRAGVYAIFDQAGSIYYIGMAQNLTSRWSGSGHHRYRQAMETIENPVIAWQIVDGRSVRNVETHLIRSFSPPWNNTAPYQSQHPVNSKKTYKAPAVNLPRIMAENVKRKLMVFGFWGGIFLLAAMCQETQPARVSQSGRTPVYDNAGMLIDRIPSSSTVTPLPHTCTPNGFVQIQYGAKTGWVVAEEFGAGDPCRTRTILGKGYGRERIQANIERKSTQDDSSPFG